jgi:hypothetical protein
VAAQVICRVIAGLRVLKERAGQDHAVVAEYLKEESFLTRRRGVFDWMTKLVKPGP